MIRQRYRTRIEICVVAVAAEVVVAAAYGGGGGLSGFETRKG